MKRGLTAHESAFTLIELLVVIAILGVLATAVVLVLNPAQLLAQGRDSTRLSDLALAELVDDPADEYRIHIQTAELNALNAALAVIKFKQIRGFYFDKDALNSLVMQVGNIKTLHEAL